MPANSPAAKLNTIAQLEFQHLTDAEIALLEGAAAGKWSYYDVGRQKWMLTVSEPPRVEVPANLPKVSEVGEIRRNLLPRSDERSVRAELIRWLCISPGAKALVDPLGIRVCGARVMGTLNLEAATLLFPIELRACRLNEVAVLNHCSIPNLSMAGSWTQGITANGLIVNGSVSMNLGFQAHGEIDLVGAKIDGVLDFRDATLLNPGGYAIAADYIRATSIVLSADWSANASGFKAEGAIWFPGAAISQDFGSYGAEFAAPRGPDVPNAALSLERASVGGSLTLGNQSDCDSEEQRRKDGQAYPRFNVKGVVDLRGARCQVFEECDWTGPVRLDGFTYETTHRPWDAKTRIAWIERDPDQSVPKQPGPTQPYHELAQYFDRVGKTSDARQVRIELERKLYRYDDNPLKLLKKPIGYGYRPENALIGVAAVCLVGWVIYRRGYRMGIMVPSDKDAARELQTTGKLPTHYPRFHPFIASLEYTFPLVKLGQADKWQADPSCAPSAEGKLFRRLAQMITLRRSLRWIIWAQILLGWLLATLFVGAVTGLVQHGS
jgi:hypothetical protein